MAKIKKKTVTLEMSNCREGEEGLPQAECYRRSAI